LKDTIAGAPDEDLEAGEAAKLDESTATGEFAEGA